LQIYSYIANIFGKYSTNLANIAQIWQIANTFGLQLTVDLAVFGETFLGGLAEKVW